MSSLNNLDNKTNTNELNLENPPTDKGGSFINNILKSKYNWLFIAIFVVVFIILGFILLVYLGIQQANRRDDALVGIATIKGGCSIIMDGVSRAEVNLDRMPTIAELSSYVDPEIYQNTYLIGTQPTTKGYRGYYYWYLETTDGKTPDEIVRAVVAYPVDYDKKHKSAYYRTTESGALFEADASQVKIPTTIKYVNNMPPPWKRIR